MSQFNTGPRNILCLTLALWWQTLKKRKQKITSSLLNVRKMFDRKAIWTWNFWWMLEKYAKIAGYAWNQRWLRSTMNSHSELSNEIPTDKWPLSLLGGWACASYRWKTSCAYGQQDRARAALNPGGLAVLPESVLPPRFGTQELFLGLHQCPSFSHEDTKCCLDLSCRFYHTRRMYYTVDIPMHPNLNETEDMWAGPIAMIIEFRYKCF